MKKFILLAGEIAVAIVADCFGGQPETYYRQGCGCGCEDCSVKILCRSDIMYTRAWHPGRCDAFGACPCTCAHPKRRCEHSAIRVNQHVYELSQIISDAETMVRSQIKYAASHPKECSPIEDYLQYLVPQKGMKDAETIKCGVLPMARKAATAFVNKSLLLDRARELGIVTTNVGGKCEIRLGDSYEKAIFGVDKRWVSLAGTRIAPSKSDLALIRALLEHEKWPQVDVYSDCVKLKYLDSLRRVATLVPTDYLSVVEKVGGENKEQNRMPRMDDSW